MLDKGRYWSAIGWLESLPGNWKENLIKSNLPCVISPVHDSDIDENGKHQKSHHHILMCWDGPITLECARKFAEGMGLGSYVERVRSLNNILDYLTHNSFSSKEKAKYNVEDIQYINCSPSDFVKIGYKQIIEYIQLNNIHQFSDLVNSLIAENENSLLEFVSQRTYYVNTYICSLKEKVDKGFAEQYQILSGIAGEIEQRGQFVLDKKTYDKLFEIFDKVNIKSTSI